MSADRDRVPVTESSNSGIGIPSPRFRHTGVTLFGGRGELLFVTRVRGPLFVGASVVRLAGAVLMDGHDERVSAKRRYISLYGQAPPSSGW
jgi:hypothetical protein